MNKIEGFTTKQAMIACLLWECQDTDQMRSLVAELGKDAEVARDMILASALDEFNDTELAQKVLSNFTL